MTSHLGPVYARTLYALRDRISSLYVGYDGFDTDFSKGISAFIAEEETLDTLNVHLLTLTEQQIIDLLRKDAKDPEWKRLGDKDRLEVVRLSFTLKPEVCDPLVLLGEKSDFNFELDLEMLKAGC
jgi:hypothetical protein